MENSDLPSATPEPVSTAALQEHVSSLQHWLVSALVLMIVVSGTFALYMRRQAKVTRAELDAIRPQAEAINAQYQKLTGSGMEDVARKLTDYGARHPDFAPILSKYGVMQPGATGAVPATAKPPVTAPAKK